jgi:hypothetical protein
MAVRRWLRSKITPPKNKSGGAPAYSIWHVVAGAIHSLTGFRLNASSWQMFQAQKGNVDDPYTKEQERRRSLQDAVKSSQESLRLANQLYANGLTDFINVLDAERSLFEAEDALAQSDMTVSADVVALYKSLGGGWESQSSPASVASAGANKTNPRTRI